ncbi:YolD-like family protein [Ureibacillus aquaedulcis]|uniref:YolD-like family protein n=1 Tax=Ureibacillus aquaedulcis TaxID=3058421 RepID=A0ABT8GVP4_9BACL|nr:YolD-like family protein [Ureibacillus sp. BA0131]MDN4495488.1 YolD-like family protein [Ureibacillus sp. BA0131]
MLKDRGNKKWTAMMLTEHVSDLRDWYESDFDVPEPDYDEVSLSSIADDLNIAYQAKSTVRIYYWSNKRQKYMRD